MNRSVWAVTLPLATAVIMAGAWFANAGPTPMPAQKLCCCEPPVYEYTFCPADMGSPCVIPGSGVLDAVIVNFGNAVTLYDGPPSSGVQIAFVRAYAGGTSTGYPPQRMEFHVPFRNGLHVSGNFEPVTVLYRR